MIPYLLEKLSAKVKEWTNNQETAIVYHEDEDDNDDEENLDKKTLKISKVSNFLDIF